MDAVSKDKKAFAIVLFSSGTFGGAQRRFTHLFLELRKRSDLEVYYFVTHITANQIRGIFGESALIGVIPVGPENTYTPPDLSQKQESPKKKKASLIPGWVRNLLPYKIYFFLKTRRAQHKLFLEIDRAAKARGIDRFLAVYTGVLPLYFYFNKKTDRPRIVFTNMDSWFSHISLSPRKDWYRQYDLFNRAHKESDMLDFLSPFVLQGIRDRNIQIPENRYKITACSFTDYSRCRVGEKKTFSVVFAARLEKDKNPLDFVHAAMALADEFPRVTFHIAGEGRLSAAVKNTLEKKPHHNIIFHGFVGNPISLLSESSLFVSLQTENNYPSQSVLEAMACANAIIATDVGDTRMFVNEHNGYLIAPGVEPLTTALRNCLNHRGDVKTKGNYGAEFVRKNFSVEKAVDYYLQLMYPGQK